MESINRRVTRSMTTPRKARANENSSTEHLKTPLRLSSKFPVSRSNRKPRTAAKIGDEILEDVVEQEDEYSPQSIAARSEDNEETPMDDVSGKTAASPMVSPPAQIIPSTTPTKECNSGVDAETSEKPPAKPLYLWVVVLLVLLLCAYEMKHHSAFKQYFLFQPSSDVLPSTSTPLPSDSCSELSQASSTQSDDAKALPQMLTQPKHNIPTSIQASIVKSDEAEEPSLEEYPRESSPEDVAVTAAATTIVDETLANESVLNGTNTARAADTFIKHATPTAEIPETNVAATPVVPGASSVEVETELIGAENSEVTKSTTEENAGTKTAITIDTTAEDAKPVPVPQKPTIGASNAHSARTMRNTILRDATLEKLRQRSAATRSPPSVIPADAPAANGGASETPVTGVTTRRPGAVKCARDPVTNKLVCSPR